MRFLTAESQSVSLLPKSAEKAKGCNWTQVIVLMTIFALCGLIGYAYCNNPMAETPSTHRYIEEHDILIANGDELNADWAGYCTPCTYGCCKYDAACQYNWGKRNTCDFRATPPQVKAPKTPKPTKAPKPSKAPRSKGGKGGKGGKGKNGGRGGDNEDEYENEE